MLFLPDLQIWMHDFPHPEYKLRYEHVTILLKARALIWYPI